MIKYKIHTLNMVEHCKALGLWCLTPLSTIFQLYRGGQFYGWRKPGEYHRPAVSLICNFYHIMEQFKVRPRDTKKQNKKVFLVFSSYTIIW